VKDELGNVVDDHLHSSIMRAGLPEDARPVPRVAPRLLSARTGAVAGDAGRGAVAPRIRGPRLAVPYDCFGVGEHTKGFLVERELR